MTLENLAGRKLLHREPADERECVGLIKAAGERLADASKSDLAYSSRFDLAYNAAHGLALAALRAAGYRSDKRYLVFQCLEHTSTLSPAAIRILSIAHERRNIAEYEGNFDEDEELLAAVIDVGQQLLEQVGVPPKDK